MTLDPKLAAALIDLSPAPGWSATRIFGVRLRKFCLWHVFLLKGIESPYIRNSRATLFDLRTAIGICRLRFGDSRIKRPWLVPVLIYLWGLLHFWNRRKGELILRSPSDAFLAYTADYIQEPEYAVIPPESDGMRPPSIPRGRADDTIEHVADLIGWSKWNDRKIWELPLGYANWLRVFALRDQGQDIDMATEDEKKFQASLPPEYRWRCR